MLKTKLLIVVTAAALALGSSAGFAQTKPDPHHPEQSGGEVSTPADQPAAGMSMMNMMAGMMKMMHGGQMGMGGMDMAGMGMFDAYARYLMADGLKPERPSDSTLSHLKISELADMIGEAEAHAKATATEVDKLKAEVKRRDISKATGQKFAVLAACSQRRSLDTAGIRKEMPPEWVAAHNRSNASTTVSVRHLET